MTQAFIIVFVALTTIGTLLQGHGWWQRHRVLRRIPADEIVDVARGVSLRVMVEGPTGIPGMKQRRGNRTRGDLLLTADRFLVTSRRGTLADIHRGKGRLLSSVRCPGPGRLVIEGDVPRDSGRVGLYRFEIVVVDADQWVERLKTFVREGGQVVSFAAT
jgi:hypothetical protein